MKQRLQIGFTIVELVIVVSIVLILATLSAASLPSLQSSTSINSAVDELNPELRQQQMKAIQGDTEGRSTNDNYGIHFDATQYVLYHGVSYDPTDVDNIVIPIKNNIQIFSTSFPSNNILFASVSGEIANYIPGSNTVVLRDVNNTSLTKTLQINRYGIITQVN